jgi:MFS family permease
MCITIVQITGGYDGSLINNLQALTTWKSALNNPDANMIGVIGAVQTVGAFVCCFPAPYIADNFGRKWAIVAGATLILIGGFLQGFAYSVAQYIVGRIVVGGGNVIAIVGATSLVNELSHPRTRSYLTGYYNVIWYIGECRMAMSLTAGSIIAAWLCYGLRLHLPTSQWGWRVPTLLMSFFAFLMICLFPFVPESPRFMIAKGRDAEAHALLAKWHANGVMIDELVAAELLEIKETFATENASKGQSKSWRQCFATPGDRWRMFICMGLATCNNWTGQSIVSYYNTQILTQAGITATLPQLGINGGLSIFDFFCAIFGGFISGRVGRRPLFLASFIGMTVAHVIVTGLSAKYAMSHIASYGYAVIAFIWIESGFYSESRPQSLRLTRRHRPQPPHLCLHERGPVLLDPRQGHVPFSFYR